MAAPDRKGRPHSLRIEPRDELDEWYDRMVLADRLDEWDWPVGREGVEA